MKHGTVILAFLASLVGPAAVMAQGMGIGYSDAEAAELSAGIAGRAGLFYVRTAEAVLYRDADLSDPYVVMDFHEPVDVVEDWGDRIKVRTDDGAIGFVQSSRVSNFWLRISKSERNLYAYRGDELYGVFPIDLSNNYFSDKVKRGSKDEPDHWRTPEGTFHVSARNDRSTFHRALVLNYPTREDAERGLSAGIIGPRDYARIVRAADRHRAPPMNTALGGLIEIHGSGTGMRTTWTRGCVALLNAHIDDIWNYAAEGTPVIIEP